jgi:hypothetical protein
MSACVDRRVAQPAHQSTGLTRGPVVAFAPHVILRFLSPIRHRSALGIALAAGAFWTTFILAGDAKVENPIRFVKVKLFFLDASAKSPLEPNQDRYVEFERKRALYGAITPSDQRERYGNYFTFIWESEHPADVVVRLEYKQQALGPMIQMKEISYRAVKGRTITRFQVTGDDYLQWGRVLAWRATLLENGRPVAEKRSYLWR